MQFIHRKLFLKYPGLKETDFKLADGGDGVVKVVVWNFAAPQPNLATLDVDIPDTVPQAEIDQKQAGGAQDDTFKPLQATLLKFVATLPGAPAALVTAAGKLP